MTVTTTDALDLGREAFRRRAWGDAFARLSEADRETPLDLDDLERLAIVAHLLGRENDRDEIGARVYHAALQQDHPAQAARAAFWLGFGLLDQGEMARGSGWLARASRVLEKAGGDHVEEGYLLLPVGLQSFDGGDPAGAYTVFEQIGGIADRFADPDLATLGRLGRGQALIRLGDREPGVALLDEAMIAVTADEVSPMIAGIVYCSVIESCQELFDLRRAQEWTEALTRWCASQPDLVPFRGQCLLQRAELARIHGAWSDADTEARRAHEEFSRPPPEAAAGAALYLQAELHRLRGAFPEAETAYRQASQWGRSLEPGLAQLRFAQGRSETAANALRRALSEADDRPTRARILDPYVEMALAMGAIESARAAADELSSIGAEIGAPVLVAIATRADGAVRLAEGDARAALSALRRSWAVWQDVDAPYEAARTRVLIGQCFRALDDEDTATLEFEAARKVFQELGADPDLARLDVIAGRTVARTAGGLTGRELEVLRLIAAGKTNRAIAADLVISEKTVARHVSNIFTKLDLSSRSAATAYAYEHDLVSPPT
jgi:DNA-binding CsgD family transcriptional regulator